MISKYREMPSKNILLSNVIEIGVSYLDSAGHKAISGLQIAIFVISRFHTTYFY